MSVGGPVEVDQHTRVDAEVLAGLQGLAEPIEAVGRDREEDLVDDHLLPGADRVPMTENADAAHVVGRVDTHPSSHGAG